MNNNRILLLFAFGALAGVALANPVVNGGFETGDLTGWTSASPPSVIADGAMSSFSASFSGAAQQSISQTLNLASGTYTLRFDLKNYGVGEDSVGVSFDGTLYLFESPISAPLESWAPYEVDVFTGGGLTELKIYGHDTLANWQLDNVSLTPVPEPATMLGLSAGLLALWRRRSRR